MRVLLPVAVITASLLAGCASTESKPAAAPAPVAAPAPAPAKAAAPARTAAQITMNELLDEPKKQAIFAKHAPHLASNSQITMARGMTLGDVAGYAEAGLTPEMLKSIVDDINKL